MPGTRIGCALAEAYQMPTGKRKEVTARCQPGGSMVGQQKGGDRQAAVEQAKRTQWSDRSRFDKHIERSKSW